MTGNPKAYRYARFSHSVQADGMSLERQADAAEAWVAQHGAELVDAFIDSGVSASRGKNLAKGAFAKFRQAVAAADVAPGSYLLVESVSRFSRLGPDDMRPVLRELVESGIRVVFFDPSVTVTADNWDSMEVGMVLTIMSYIAKAYSDQLRAYREKSWSKAREGMRNGKAATVMLPYWLTCAKLEDGTRGPIELHPTYAPIVERIFREYLAGRGKGQIAATLNAEKIAPPTRVGSDTGAAFWRHGLIGRTLANRAVIGEFQPHREVKTRITLKSGIAGALKRKREATGEPIPGYYPAVIPADVFAQAEALRESRLAKAGRALGSARVNAVTHILSRLAVCPVCGHTMKRSNKGDAPRYVCTRAVSGKAGVCKRVYVPVADVETALTAAADTLATGAPGADPEATRQLAALEVRHAEAAAKVSKVADRIVAMIENGEEVSSVVNATHGKLEAQRDSLAAELETLRNRSAATQPNVVKQRLSAMVGALKGYVPGAPGPFDYDAPYVNGALYACFEKAVVDYRSGELVLHWRHGPPPSTVKYGK